MKIRILSIISLILVSSSCQTESTQDDKIAIDEKSVGQTEELFNPEEPIEEAVEVEKESNWIVYEGFIGDYEKHVVVTIALADDNTVKGTYFYDKHQKHLDLSGTYDPKSGNYNLTESYKNKTTGLLQFKNFNGDLKGEWKKNAKDVEPQEIKLRLLYSPGKEKPTIEFSTYEMKHEITFYNGADGSEEIEKATDILKVAIISRDFKSFSYNIIRRNGHMGSADGIIRMEKNTAKQIGHFYGVDNCDLVFTFSGKSVDVEEHDCEYYHGANAYLDGGLTKVK